MSLLKNERGGCNSCKGLQSLRRYTIWIKVLRMPILFDREGRYIQDSKSFESSIPKSSLPTLLYTFQSTVGRIDLYIVLSKNQAESQSKCCILSISVRIPLVKVKSIASGVIAASPRDRFAMIHCLRRSSYNLNNNYCLLISNNKRW